MKNLLLLCVFVLTGSNLLFSQKLYKEITCPVENISWGMSYEDVLDELEDANEFQENIILDAVYDETGALVQRFYHFKEDQLYMIAIFHKDYVSMMDYTKKFEEVEDIIKKQYGTKPTEFKWTDDELKNDPDKHCLAIAMGKLALVTTRELMDGEIVHDMRIDPDKELMHMITYINKDYPKMDD